MKITMGKTTSHRYSTPSEGTADWHIPLNQNFEQLDLDVEIRGLESEKVIMKRKLVQSLKLLILVEYTMETEIIGFYPIKSE